MGVSEYNKKAKAGNLVVAVAILVCGISFLLYRVGLLTKMVSLNDMASGLVIVVLVLLFGLVVAYQWHINAQRKEIMDRDREISFVQSAMDLHNIVTVTGADSTIVSVNDKFLKVFGYSKYEAVGKKMDLIYSDLGDDSVYSEILEFTSQGKIWEGRHPARTKSGEIRYFRATIVPQFDDRGNHISNVSIRHDITDLRKAEQTKRTNAILSKLHDEIYIFDSVTLDVVYMNERALQRCEWTAEESATKRIVDTDENFHEMAFRAHVRPLFDGSKSSVVISVKQAKGYVEVHTSLLEQLDGTTVFVSILRDINDRMELDKAKMSSVSVVSHELRTPITSIKGSLQLLQAQTAGALNESSESMVAIALRNCDRLMFIVNDILDMEKIHSGKMEYDRQNHNLRALLEESLDVNKGYGDQHDVSFEYVASEDEAHAVCDRDRMIQVMSNLMSNAVKFSPKGGVVEIGLQDNVKNWCISVADRGPGINPEDQSRLFESFSQAKPADGKKRAGTGLGLAITKKIVQHHGGTLGLKSEVGKGTTFYVYLPKPEKLAA
ncbi:MULTISPECIES: PAS domain-containing sensor histidine kinase [Rhodobacterales]|uniref:PAS domain-containing sensor histidine kinase n=1 Tax=Roseobacter sp. N2S TaxID=2663844 RepID=UPI00286575F6|nr:MULTISPECIES: PAS domain-containing sensor histidine kinase [Rhodobacterales]MDR6265222.1 PAS domain S-box-containing protein [Roseobacter sp. N2S]